MAKKIIRRILFGKRNYFIAGDVVDALGKCGTIGTIGINPYTDAIGAYVVFADSADWFTADALTLLEAASAPTFASAL